MGSAPNGYQTPKTNWQAADVVQPADMNRIEGNIQAIEEGSRAIDPSQAPSGNNGTLQQVLDWFANRIKAITGGANWWDAPVATLASLLSTLTSHISLTTLAHGGITPASHIGSGGTAHAVATTSTAGFMSANDKVALSNKVDKPTSAASDNIAVFDGGAGKIKDGGISISALQWVEPGDTVAVEYLPEQDFGGNINYSGSTFFLIVRPGRYRITGSIRAREGKTAKVVVAIPSSRMGGNGAEVLYASSNFSTTSTSYVSFTLDMTKPIGPGGVLCVGVEGGYIKDIRVKYRDASSIPSPQYLGGI